jgi:hypothetical protein
VHVYVLERNRNRDLKYLDMEIYAAIEFLLNFLLLLFCKKGKENHFKFEILFNPF